MKLGINSRRNTGKYSNMWKWNNTLLKNQWIKGEIKSEIRKYLKINKSENTRYQNLWDTAKAVPRGKFLMINTYIKKEERSQIKPNFTHQGTRKRRTK